MPKVGSSKTDLIKKWHACFKYDGSVVFCTACTTEINVNKQFQLDQHVATGPHQKRRNNANEPQQQLLLNCLNKNENFSSINDDLCKMMISCNIPLNNLDVPEFKQFLEKYTKEKAGSRRTAASRTHISKLVLTKPPKPKEDCIANFIVGVF